MTAHRERFDRYIAAWNELDSQRRKDLIVGPDGGPAVAGGVDFGVTRGGMLQRITGFIDSAPKPPAQEER